ncbi:protein FAM177A1-like [Tigriopus californicus]|uniref:protein FAM177A1-like n=1 Tax=Tigriopus californicus TaxID=6832 RepID=UPI0027D9E915|nr:protein FAM177A1-like [Tigriopus californicus]
MKKEPGTVDEGNEILLHDKDSPKHNNYQTLSPSRKPLPLTAPAIMSSSLEDINLNSPVHRGTNASPEASGQDSAPKPKRVPRRIIHCSDGVIEEYSTDDEQADGSDLATESKMASPKLDTKTLAWMPWMIHHTWFAGSTILSYCDFWGEKLAWIFGITSPKYYYEIEEFKRIEEEEKERMARQDAEMQGWQPPKPTLENNTITEEAK